MIDVAIADDQALVRAGFASRLAATPDMDIDIDVVGEAGDGTEAVELARRTRPDVFLMDVRMPRMAGIEPTRAIVADPRGSRTPRPGRAPSSLLPAVRVDVPDAAGTTTQPSKPPGLSGAGR